jgi:transposase
MGSVEGMKMTKATRARYTLEFKEEAVRLVESGQSIAAAARSVGMVEQTLFNWVKASRPKYAPSRSTIAAADTQMRCIPFR